MKRAEAFALVRKRGGSPQARVTKRTDVLVVGEFGWPLLDDGRPSNGLTRAMGYGVPIASERQFLEWLGRSTPRQQTAAYSPDQLAALSNLPRAVIDQLGMFGVIERRNDLYGFLDLAAARQIAGLFAAGITLSAVTRSLYEIRKWLPDARLSNLRLSPESSDRIVVEQLNRRTDRTGQFLLDVEASAEDADALFERAQAAEDENETDLAERLYRRVMQFDPADPAAPFNLGNLLRSSGRAVEAEAAYRGAVKADPGYAVGWYNLADLLDDQNRTEEAVVCLEHALKADPAFSEAAFNMGLFLQRLERTAEAVVWWRRYLELDHSSEWASRARRALKYCEIRLAASS